MSYSETIREIHNAGPDFVDYSYGVFAAMFCVGMVQWMSSPIPGKALFIFGGIGVAAVLAFDIGSDVRRLF